MSILARLYQLKLEKQGLVDELLLFMPLYICLSHSYIYWTNWGQCKRLILNVQDWTAPKEEHLSTMVSSFLKAWLLTS